MKNSNVFLFCACLFYGGVVFCQNSSSTNSKYFTTSLNFGINTFSHRVNPESSRAKPGPSINFNGAYMLNPWFGVRSDIQYNIFNSTQKPNLKSLHFGANALFDFSSINQPYPKNTIYGFTYQGYMGFGLATMWQGKFRSYEEGDYYIQGNDDMLFINIGFNPKYKLDQNMCINFDFSYVSNFLQDNYFDGSGMYDFKGYGGFFRLGVGVSYEFK